ncbi:MAG: zinc ABC transporter substrate-binding protein [Campylobacterota bacterium]|nr:zinc ABC transporter substrate-binding protein [Campylobacterota bacterium]
MLKKILIIGFLGLGSVVNANVNAIVSVLPQVTFLKAIGGDKVNISLMVKPGNSPHTYEPKPSQMRSISKADVYFAIGVEFEKIWLPKFINQNNKMKVLDIGNGVTLMEMEKHHKDNYKENHNHKTISFDPHIWTSPDNVRVIIKNILKYLVKIDNKNKEYYTNNYKKFIDTLDETDNKIKNILKELPRDAKFMVFHPAWGYFAKQYCLKQIPIEIEGKSPKPKDIIKLINDAKEQNIKAIFTAPEFSEKVAKRVATELNIPIVKISPLNPKWSKNLIKLAKSISNK